MCVFGSFRRQCVLLGLLGGKVSCWVFYVAKCVVVSFRWQSLFPCLLGGNVCSWVF